jgi:hypothetical protein
MGTDATLNQRVPGSSSGAPTAIRQPDGKLDAAGCENQGSNLCSR